jgi:hypothetical protein
MASLSDNNIDNNNNTINKRQVSGFVNSTDNDYILDLMNHRNDDLEIFTTMEELLAVPVELLFARIPLREMDDNNNNENNENTMMETYTFENNTNNDRMNLMTLSEYNCFLEIILLSQRIDAITSIMMKAMERKMEYQFFLSQLPNTDPYMIPFNIILHNLSTATPNHCICMAHNELNSIKEQFQLCVTQLRRDCETNWDTASLLRMNGANIPANAKQSLSDIQEELCLRIEEHILMTLESLTPSSNLEMNNNALLLSSKKISMTDFCINLFPWLLKQIQERDEGSDDSQSVSSTSKNHKNNVISSKNDNEKEKTNITDHLHRNVKNETSSNIQQPDTTCHLF